MATIGCGISHKDTKHTDKCSNKKKTTQKPNGETTDKFQNTVKIRPKKSLTYYKRFKQHATANIPLHVI
jgi:hypothetical protein